jgi:indole-3-glycerol phosphate synthase
MNILDKIVGTKKIEIADRKRHTSDQQLMDRPFFTRERFSMSRSIIDGSGVIAEFKKKSPSKPEINTSASVMQIVPAYANAGASASSILTDVEYFGGCDQDIIDVRAMVEIPILRKEFIIDPYQIIEARSIGADCILLIAEILTKDQVKILAKVAEEYGLEVILEIHTADQIEKFNDYIQTIGVNNRNLKTFVTDIAYSTDIYPQLPQSAVKISESGLHEVVQVNHLIDVGFDGFLIGENFMKTSDPGAACADFISQMHGR